MIKDFIIFELIPERSKLSLSLGSPPKIQKIFLLFFNAYFVESKLVALESLIKVILFFFKNISCLCGRPLKAFTALRKIFSLILKYLDILYANIKFSKFGSVIK